MGRIVRFRNKSQLTRIQKSVIDFQRLCPIQTNSHSSLWLPWTTWWTKKCPLQTILNRWWIKRFQWRKMLNRKSSLLRLRLCLICDDRSHNLNVAAALSFTHRMDQTSSMSRWAKGSSKRGLTEARWRKSRMTCYLLQRWRIFRLQSYWLSWSKGLSMLKKIPSQVNMVLSSD